MHDRRVAILTVSILLTRSAYAANPFLAAPDDKPVTAEFRGTEWGDNISQEEIPLTARLVTTRVAKMPWGAIFKIDSPIFNHPRRSRARSSLNTSSRPTTGSFC